MATILEFNTYIYFVKAHSTIIHVHLSLGSIKFLVFIFSYCPTPLHVKTVFCYDGNLGFFINTKNTHFVKDHPRHIPAKLPSNGSSKAHSSQACLQMVHWFQIGILWIYYSGIGWNYKFAL